MKVTKDKEKMMAKMCNECKGKCKQLHTLIIVHCPFYEAEKK